MQDAPQPLPHVRPLAELVGDDVADAEQHVGDRGDLGVGVDEVRGPLVEIGRRRVTGENLPRQRLQAALLRDLGQRELAGLERQIEVFELLGALRRGDSRLQVGGQPALPLDRSQDRLLAVGELPGLADALGDPAHVLLVETAGVVPTVPRDERNGVARVEQLHRRIDAGRG